MARTSAELTPEELVMLSELQGVSNDRFVYKDSLGNYTGRTVSLGINVKDYGAVGDGVTNDTTAFQDAVDALPTDGGSITVPYGVYNLTLFPNIGTKSVNWEIDMGATFNGTGYPSMSTNAGQVAVGPYIKSQSDYVSPVVNGGIAAFNIEMLQPATYVGQSVGLYVGAKGSNSNSGANVWAINGLIRADVGAGGTYQCMELDVDNYSASAIVKGISISGVGTNNPTTGLEITRANSTKWGAGIEIRKSTIGMIVYGDSSTGYESIKLENISELNNTTKGIKILFDGRSYNTPTNYRAGEIEINPIDADWNDARYTINLRSSSALSSVFEAKTSGIFMGFDTITQNHIIRQGAGDTRFRRSSTEYIGLETNGTNNKINSLAQDFIIGTSDAKDLYLATSGTNRLRVLSTGNIVVNNSLGVGNIPTEFLTVYNASASQDYFGIYRGGNKILFNMNSTNNEINSTGKIMKIGTSDAFPFVIYSGGSERVRIDNSTGGMGVGGAPNSKAILDAQSTTLGFLLPRMTTTQKNAITTPTTSLLVYDSDLAKFQYYSGSAWTDLGGGFSWGATAASTSGTGLTLTVSNSASASTVAQSIVIGNTQTNVITGLKVDMGTSAIGNTGLSILNANASASAYGININPGTTGTGIGIYFSNFGGNGYSHIKFPSWLGVSGNSGNAYGIFQQKIQGYAGGTSYGLYQGTINDAAGGSGYGIYQSIIGTNNTSTATGWHINNLDSGANGTNAKFASLNYSISGTLANRTSAMYEIYVSRTSTRTTGTTTDNYDLLHIKQTSIKNGTGGTLISQGSILKLENVPTQTAGTLTDTNVPLSLIQGNASNGGHIRFNAYTAAAEASIPNNTLWYNGTDFKFKNNAGTIKTITAI